jgi:hypothetical protein
MLVGIADWGVVVRWGAGKFVLGGAVRSTFGSRLARLVLGCGRVGRVFVFVCGVLSHLDRVAFW